MAFHSLKVAYRLPRPEFNNEEFHSLTAISPILVDLTLDQEGLLWSNHGNERKREEYSGELRFATHFAPEYMGGYGRGRAEFCATLVNGVVQSLRVNEIVRPYIG